MSNKPGRDTKTNAFVRKTGAVPAKQAHTYVVLVNQDGETNTWRGGELEGTATLVVGQFFSGSRLDELRHCLRSVVEVSDSLTTNVAVVSLYDYRRYNVQSWQAWEQDLPKAWDLWKRNPQHDIKEGSVGFQTRGEVSERDRTNNANTDKPEGVGAHDLALSRIGERDHEAVVAHWAEVGRRVAAELADLTSPSSVVESVRVVENARRVVEAELAHELAIRLGWVRTEQSCVDRGPNDRAIDEARLAAAAGTLEHLRAPIVRFLTQLLTPSEGRAVDAHADAFASVVMLLADSVGLRVCCGCSAPKPSVLSVWRRASQNPLWRIRHEDTSECTARKLLPRLSFMEKSPHKGFQRKSALD